jgi:proteasome lid subunit RPN8/RPN11
VSRLVLAASLLAEIGARAAQAWPDECCGLLVGRRVGDSALVGRAVAAANVAAEPARRFEVDPATLLATHRTARAAGEEILGPYHSHPDGPAQPSATDLARARDAAGPGEVWLIVPVARGAAGTARAWAYDGKAFAEAAIVPAGSGADSVAAKK